MLKEFDKEAYSKSFILKKDWRFLFNCIASIMLLWFLYYSFLDIINKEIVDEYLSRFKKTPLLLGKIPLFDCFFIVFTIYIFADLFIKICKEELFPSKKARTVFFSFSLLFYVPIRICNLYEFYFIFNTQVAYFDILLLFISYRLTNFKSYSKLSQVSNTENSITVNKTNIVEVEDLYNRTDHAKHILKTIQNTTTDEAVSIGVFAEWGSGKTDFIKRIIKEAEKDKFIIMEFNPWLASGKSEMIDDFFKELGKSLKPYNKSIISKIKKYSANIFQTSKSEYSKLIDSIINEFIPTKSIKEDFDEINTLIKSTGKRLIVFIDDLDRLTGSEILQIFRIIRNSANFSNTFFITTLDYDYVISQLNESKEIVNEEQYLKKIFQSVVVLPKIQKESFKNQLITLFNSDFKDNEDAKKEWKTLLEQICKQENKPGRRYNYENLIEGLLDNTRDLLLFYNSFKLSYQRLKGEVEIYDLALLELLKVSNFEIYKELLNEKYWNFSNLFVSNEEISTSISNHIKSKKTINSNKTKELLIQLLKQLFDENKASGYKNISKFSDRINFEIYTTFKNPEDLVSRKDFYDSISEDDDDTFYEKILSWYNTKKQYDLIYILEHMQDIENYERFQRIVMARLILNNQIMKGRNSIHNIVKFIVKFNQPGDKKDTKFHLNILENIKIEDTDIIQLFESIINYSNMNLSTKLYFLEAIKTEFQQRHYENSKIGKYICEDKFELKMLEIFKMELYDKGKKEIPLHLFSTFREKSLMNENYEFQNGFIEIFKEFLSKDVQHFENYLKTLIIPYKDYELNPFEFREPIKFKLQIFFHDFFDSIEAFKEKLQNVSNDDEEVARIKNIIQNQDDRIYSLANSENSFNLSDDEQKFILALPKSSFDYFGE